MFNVGMGLAFTGLILSIVGGLALIGLLIAGIYVLIIESAATGLMMIGGAVVGGWILNLVSGLFMVAGETASNSSIEREKPE